MKTPFIWTLVTCLSILPTAVRADVANSQPSAPVKLQNVQLDESGTITGVLLNEVGAPAAGQAIELHTRGGIEKIQTAHDGSFRLSEKHVGQVGIKVNERYFGCRVWKHNTAPPKSLSSFTVVNSDDPIVRANNRGGSASVLTAEQWFGLALFIGMIVAVVVAVDNASD